MKYVKYIFIISKKPMMDFVNTLGDMFELNINPIFNWLPVIEENCDENHERYLIEDPYTSMTKGEIYKVPVIIGITEYEFYYTGYCKFTL